MTQRRDGNDRTRSDTGVEALPVLRPMNDFDPSQHALLHDELNDYLLPWTGELEDEWRKWVTKHDEGAVNWDGLLIDGWIDLSDIKFTRGGG